MFKDLDGAIDSGNGSARRNDNENYKSDVDADDKPNPDDQSNDVVKMIAHRNI